LEEEELKDQKIKRGPRKEVVIVQGITERTALECLIVYIQRENLVNFVAGIKITARNMDIILYNVVMSIWNLILQGFRYKLTKSVIMIFSERQMNKFISNLKNIYMI
jgi:hypothetical protein